MFSYILHVFLFHKKISGNKVLINLSLSKMVTDVNPYFLGGKDLLGIWVLLGLQYISSDPSDTLSVGNCGPKVIAYCFQNIGKRDFLSHLGAPQVWSI